MIVVYKFAQKKCWTIFSITFFSFWQSIWNITLMEIHIDCTDIRLKVHWIWLWGIFSNLQAAVIFVFSFFNVRIPWGWWYIRYNRLESKLYRTTGGYCSHIHIVKYISVLKIQSSEKIFIRLQNRAEKWNYSLLLASFS